MTTRTQRKRAGTPPINFLKAYLGNICAYCKESETETYCANEATQARKPLWVCILRPDIAKGHIACTQQNWHDCPLRR